MFMELLTSILTSPVCCPELFMADVGVDVMDESIMILIQDQKGNQYITPNGGDSKDLDMHFKRSLPLNL